MAIFVKNCENVENHNKGEFVKILEFTLVINCVILPQKRQLKFKNDSFEVSRNSAYLFIQDEACIFCMQVLWLFHVLFDPFYIRDPRTTYI